jgi:DNA-binding SARP family transcriptional activator/tetratricopeptide (TPR) repeat protein
VELGVLGPLELLSGGAPIPLGGPKQRLVLGLLAARRGRIVVIDDLIDGLWPDGPQARPRKTVQVYVTRLRRALGAQADAIRSEAGGYRLDPALLPVDADAFEHEVREATADPDQERGAAVLRRALERWRGDAYGDLRECLDLVPDAVELDARRLAAQFELFERLVRRRPREILAELEQAVEANPLHEGLAGQLMTAQYLVGRQADALQTYRALRRRLREDLGLDPGPALRELEGRIVRHELAVESAPTVAPHRQRRRVSVVSLELSVTGPAPLDPEVEMAVAAPARRAARSRLVERGGVILSAAGDGMSACFGYPSAERSVERAVLAALAIRDLADDSLVVRIGVDTGIVVIEGAGESELSGIAGEPLRAATRLRGLAAPGQVVLGASTAAAAAEVVATAALDEPDGAFVAGEALETQHGPSTVGGLVAREAAVAELDALAERAISQLVPVVLSGPAGIGKSAVVERFAGERFPDAVWLFCDRRHSATPLHPLRPVLPELFDAGGEPTTRSILAALGLRWNAALPVLVVEDVDAADPSSLDLLDALPDHLAHGLVLMTTRSASPLEIAGDVVARIALGPLDRASSRTLAAGMAGGRRLRLDTLNEIADRSGGVPLHVRALTRAVLDSGAGTTAVPTSLYDSLMATIDRLGPARRLAQRLAVLGPSFDATEIADVAGGASVAADLEAMVAADVLRGDGDRYRFASALVAETAYESLLNADRIALHETIADAMTRRGAPPERLAFHLEAAGRPFDAAVAWRRASTDAVRRARHREAIHHARRALQVLERIEPAPDGGDTRRRALITLAIGLQASAHTTEELLAVVAEARRAGVGADDLPRRLVLDVMEISALHEAGEFVDATKVAQQLADDARAAGDDVSTAYAMQFLGACHVWRGQLALGTSDLEDAVALFEATQASNPVGVRSEGAMWTLLGLAACFADRPDDVVRMLDRARGVIPADDGYTRCLVAATAAMADQLADRPATVRADVEPVWALAMDLGSDFWFAWAQALLGWAIAADDAEAGLAMMAESVDATTTRQTKPYFLGLLGARLCEHGQIGEGLDRLDQALALLDDTDERLWEPLLRLNRARWLAASGDHAGAEREGETAAAMAAATGQQLIVRWHDEWRRRR